jgi:hypothetical protein
LKRSGELHLKVQFVSTMRAVAADMYLKKLERSWVLFGDWLTMIVVDYTAMKCSVSTISLLANSAL